MANYNTFVVIDCKTRKPLLTTSSARKANSQLKAGVRVEVWNNNDLVEKIYESDKKRERSPLAPYIQKEREHIGRKQAAAERKNKKRRQRVQAKRSEMIG